MNVSGVKRLSKAQDQGSRKQFIVFPPCSSLLRLFSSRLKWKFGNWIAGKGKIAPTSNVSNPIGVQAALYITIDPGAAGIWAGIINGVKTVMDNNGCAINCTNEMIDLICSFVLNFSMSS